MTFGLVLANYSLPEWQAVKLTFFAPCYKCNVNSLKIRLSHYCARRETALKVSGGE